MPESAGKNKKEQIAIKKGKWIMYL